MEYDPNAFDQFRDNHPGWEKLTVFEVALLFWRGAINQSNDTKETETHG